MAGNPGPDAPAPAQGPPPRRRRPHPWEVDHVIPPPGPTPAKMPWLVRQVYRGYSWCISTPRRRQFYVITARLVLVIGMVALATYLMWPELTNASAADPSPLTLSQSFFVGRENLTVVGGLVEGDDVIAGNYSVQAPPGAPIEFKVCENGTAPGETYSAPLYSTPGEPSTQTFDFTASYTDWYYFIWTNPSNFNVTLYVSMTYLSSAPPA